MKCLYPILVKDTKGVLVHAPCGQCLHCRLNYARQWSIRITHEQLKCGDNSCFLTLTYDPEHLPADGSVHKRELQLFLKRFRKQLGVNKIRYFGCGEYGDTFGRPHYHVIVFGVPVDSKVFKNRHVHYEKGRPSGWHADLDSWPFGKVHIGTVTTQSANYVAGYVLKKVKGPNAEEYYSTLGIEPEFVLMSRRPGIGSDYVISHSDYYTVHRYVTIKGVKYPLPRFYVDRTGKKITADTIKRMKEQREIEKGLTWFDREEASLQAEKNTKARLRLRR